MARKIKNTLSFTVDNDPAVAYSQLTEAKKAIEAALQDTLRTASKAGMRPGTLARQVRDFNGTTSPDNAVVYHAMRSLGLLDPAHAKAASKPAPKSRAKKAAPRATKTTAAATRRTNKVTARTSKPAARGRRGAK